MAKIKDQRTEKYLAGILEVIKKHNLYQIVDIFAYYTGCSRETFYQHDLHKSDKVLKALDDNKTKTKQTLKEKWLRSDNPTLQVALFKLLADNDEHKKLSLNHTDVTSNGNSIAVSFVPVPDAGKDD